MKVFLIAIRSLNALLFAIALQSLSFTVGTDFVLGCIAHGRSAPKHCIRDGRCCQVEPQEMYS